MVNGNSIVVAQKDHVRLLLNDRTKTIDLFPCMHDDVSEGFSKDL
jgi:hypothetical protein